MAASSAAELKAESHLILDQTLLRMPLELSRKNLKTALRYVEHDSKELLSSLKSTTQQAANNAPNNTATLESIDSMVSRMQKLKRKMMTLHEEELKIHRSSKARISHLQDLYSIRSLEDVKYRTWSQTRLDRLLVDYLLRSGYVESAAHLAKEKGIEESVDVDAFRACLRIERCLRKERKTAEALHWCSENKSALKKMGSELEFELRLQQYIELVREGNGTGFSMDGIEREGFNVDKLRVATEYARKHLSGSSDMDVLGKAAGLLAFDMRTEVEPYKSLYSLDRWSYLASLFLKTHHSIYNLPARPLLHVALSAGLSALKTPACHSCASSPTKSAVVCPICSTELNELARNVPYAHHSKSIVDSDPVVLPNGRVCGMGRLLLYNDKVGTESGWVRDPESDVKGEQWRMEELRKVFIS